MRRGDLACKQQHVFQPDLSPTYHAYLGMQLLNVDNVFCWEKKPKLIRAELTRRVCFRFCHKVMPRRSCWGICFFIAVSLREGTIKHESLFIFIMILSGVCCLSRKLWRPDQEFLLLSIICLYTLLRLSNSFASTSGRASRSRLFLPVAAVVFKMKCFRRDVFCLPHCRAL